MMDVETPQPAGPRGVEAVALDEEGLERALGSGQGLLARRVASA
jgi:hypothetical protein